MKIPAVVRQVRKYADENAPIILTGMGVAGAVLTTYLTAKATFKAADDITAAEVEGGQRLENTEKVKLVWQHYVLPAGTLAGSSACMIMATKIGLDRTAAVAGAFVVAERANEKYRDKVKELVGENKQTKIHDAVAIDQVEKLPSANFFDPREGEQLFVDAWSGRAISTTMAKMESALNDFNKEMIYGHFASLNEFYKRLGLEDITQGESVGWNKEELLELVYTTVLKDDRAVVVYSFGRNPKPDFRSNYV